LPGHAGGHAFPDREQYGLARGVDRTQPFQQVRVCIDAPRGIGSRRDQKWIAEAFVDARCIGQREVSHDVTAGRTVAGTRTWPAERAYLVNVRLVRASHADARLVTEVGRSVIDDLASLESAGENIRSHRAVDVLPLVRGIERRVFTS
jgi:hypothetical protein